MSELLSFGRTVAVHIKALWRIAAFYSPVLSLRLLLAVFIPCVGLMSATMAEVTAKSPNFAQTSDRIELDTTLQSLKQDAVGLAADIFSLREDIISPPNNQLVVFLSVDVGDVFSLNSVQIRVDGKQVTNLVYTEQQSQALLRGSAERVYLGKISDGDHQLLAIFIGRGSHGRQYRRAVQLGFTKAIGPKYLELKISDQKTPGLPQFELRDWQ